MCCMVLSLLPMTAFAENGTADVKAQLKAIGEAKAESFDAKADEPHVTPQAVQRG